MLDRCPACFAKAKQSLARPHISYCNNQACRVLEFVNQDTDYFTQARRIQDERKAEAIGRTEETEP